MASITKPRILMERSPDFSEIASVSLATSNVLLAWGGIGFTRKVISRYPQRRQHLAWKRGLALPNSRGWAAVLSHLSPRV
jgi:hypothetical protein